MTIAENSFPVIDLFAGPGGLGEGFASLRQSDRYAFHTALSIEKDETAHSTLRLRHFFHTFEPDHVPQDYYDYLERKITIAELYERHPAQAEQASKTAWRCTLGEQSHADVYKHIASAVDSSDKWVLVGGPPCQAYSVIGRSRMSGNAAFEDDPRHFLYREYLRILADHRPPVFVMENVVGLLSATVRGERMISRILRDLSNPASAIHSKDHGYTYRLFSLTTAGGIDTDANPATFVVNAEEYGIPQARHRIFIVGVRSDTDVQPSILEKLPPLTVQDVIGTMPRLRGGVSKGDSYQAWLKVLEQVRQHHWYRQASAPDEIILASEADRVLKSLEQDCLYRSDSISAKDGILPDWFVDERLSVLTSHETRSHMESDLHRYFYAAIFASIHQISPRLASFPMELLPHHNNVTQGVSGKMFSDRFRVQLPHRPSTTVTSHISKDGHYFIHYDPTQCRSLTVREAARLQTFPDNYKFEGPRTEQYHQVGNAVPPLLANQIAEIIHEVLMRMN